MASPVRAGIHAAKGLDIMNRRIRVYEDDTVEVTWIRSAWPHELITISVHTCPPKPVIEARSGNVDADGTSNGRGRAQASEQPRDGD